MILKDLYSFDLTATVVTMSEIPGTLLRTLQDDAGGAAEATMQESPVATVTDSELVVNAAAGNKNILVPTSATAKVKKADLFRFNVTNCAEWCMFDTL